MILSVVIPCYNHGKYIQEAIDSVLTYQDQPIEIIIVDDGSTDSLTIAKMDELKSLGYHVIQQYNSGLAKARNTGIAAAKGKYILPLDADNKIMADYIIKATKLLDSRCCDIVFAKPSFFGQHVSKRIFKTHEFNATELFFGNYIDACAIFRKEVWVENNGYDFNMPYQGFEDWDFWLNSHFNNFKFHFLDEELYFYRILENSMMSKQSSLNKDDDTKNFLMGKYGVLILNELSRSVFKGKLHDRDMLNPGRSIVKYIYQTFKKYFYR